MVVSLRNKEILLFQQDGMLTKDEYSKAIDYAFEAAKKVRELQVAAITSRYGSMENELEKAAGVEQ